MQRVRFYARKRLTGTSIDCSNIFHPFPFLLIHIFHVLSLGYPNYSFPSLTHLSSTKYAIFRLVWDAIALHTIGTIVFHKEPEVQAVCYGIWADFQGPDRIEGNLLTWDEYNVVVAELPRLSLMKGLKGLMCHFCETKPATTIDNTVGEWGDKFVKGYDRAGKLTCDLLLTCDLDGKSLLEDP